MKESQWKGAFYVFGFFGILAMICVMVLFVQGCAGPGEPVKDPILTNGYRTLASLDTAYDLAWGSFAQLYKDGLVKDETMTKAKAMAWTYFNRWSQASKVLKGYAAGTQSADSLQAALDLARAGLDELKAYLREQAGDNVKIL